MTNKNPLPPRRNFNLRKTARYGRPPLSPDQLVRWSPKWQFSRLFNFPFPGSHFRPRMHSLVVAVDGGYRRVNDRRNSKTARAACAVYFGPGSADNHAELLEDKEDLMPPTSNRAELRAAIVALEIVSRRVKDGRGWEIVREVVLMTDSAYVAESLSRWVWKWERNGWKTWTGGTVQNRDLIERLHADIKAFERDGVAVRFWKVRREWNTVADGMVKSLLDGKVLVVEEEEE